MFKEMLGATVEPLEEVCKAVRAEVREDNGTEAQARETQAEVFLLNCLLEIWSPLSKQSSCAAQAAQLKQRIDAQVCVLSGVLWIL
jgi:hypothetical protein